MTFKLDQVLLSEVIPHNDTFVAQDGEQFIHKHRAVREEYKPDKDSARERIQPVPDFSVCFATI